MGELSVVFEDRSRRTSCDLLIPLDITAHQLVLALKESFQINSPKMYLRCEQPDALLCGHELLSQFRLQPGCVIYHQD
ncbi:MAG TPA: hypothetical protein PKZ39_05165 [Clostridia bacterium]|nr:hypothetical protein [Clostridia bacterium]